MTRRGFAGIDIVVAVIVTWFITMMSTQHGKNLAKKCQEKPQQVIEQEGTCMSTLEYTADPVIDLRE